MKQRLTPLIPPIPVTAYATVSAAGLGTRALHGALVAGETCLTPPSVIKIDFPAVAGEVRIELPEVSQTLQEFSTRNARIALAALNHEEDGLRSAVTHAVEKYGQHRIGIVLGTSTSGIFETENAYRHLVKTGRLPEEYSFSKQHTWVATAHYLRQELDLKGPCYSISTACSSGSKAIACAQRLIHTGVCDAVLTGGVDSLCRLTFYGFKSLELMAEGPCTPLDEHRDGISLGEGAGLLLLEKPSPEHAGYIHLLGAGESSDAHHMTAPHPDGRGAALAMRAALQQAGLNASDIDYINLHATGTSKNDEAEMNAMASVFDPDCACGGTKGLTGHTLGAAGGIEAVISLLAIERRIKPGTCGMKQADSRFKVPVLKETEEGAAVSTALSNSFGFGGINAALVFGELNG